MPQTRTRSTEITVVGIEKMPTGLSIDTGLTHPAYLASSVHDGNGLVAGASARVEYHMDERDGSKFARITAVESVRAPDKATGDEHKTHDGPQVHINDFAATVVGIEPMRSGLSIDFGKATPAYLARSVHDGEGITEGACVAGRFHMDPRNDSEFARIVKITSVSAAK